MKKNGNSIISKVFLEFVYGGHLLSIGASAIIFSIIILLKLPFNFLLVLIPYLSSQVVYTYNHFREIEFDTQSNPERASHIKAQSKLTLLLLFAYSGLLVIVVLFTNILTITYVLAVVVSGLLYTEYFKTLTTGRLAGFKNFYTSFFWASTTYLVPLFYNSELDLKFLYLFLFVFFRWIVNSAFFDIKDINSDKERGLKTFAVIFGKSKTIFLLQVVNIISLIPLLLGIGYEKLPINTLALSVFVLYGLCYLLMARNLEGKKLRNFSYIVVDAEYIFWPILVLISNYIL